MGRYEKSSINWDDIVFEVELLKSQEINLDYILEQIFENNKKVKNKTSLIEIISSMTKASIDNRAKNDLLIDFINQTDLNKLNDKNSVMEAFFNFAQEKKRYEAENLIKVENLNIKAAKHYINLSMKQGFASDNGTELNDCIPKMSLFDPMYISKKQNIFQKISDLIEKFKDVDGQI